MWLVWIILVMVAFVVGLAFGLCCGDTFRPR